MKLSTILTLAIAATLISCDSSGTVIQNKGSDTLVNVAQAWAEEYRNISPSCAVAVSGGGSGTGISAMVNGTVDIANSSRAMKEKELGLARDKGIDPIEFIVGYDALAIYVHKENPIESITIEQLEAIYGDGGYITRWSQLGITMTDKASDEIVRVSRQNNSGTYVYFREAVLGREGNYKLGSLDMHGSKDVVELVQNTPGAIGYSGLAYATDHVKIVPVSTDGADPVVPTVDSASDQSYPIARPLFMYTAGVPEGVVKEYMDWILSEEGQTILLKKGYAPVRNLKYGGDRTLIHNKGSDALVDVAQAWAEEYLDVNTQCAVAVSGGGSGTGISAMVNGTVDIASSGRTMKEKELGQARDKGVDPTSFVVGYEALAVYVHKENPIESITIEQLAAMYGDGGGITRWSQLGITMPDVASDEIVRVSRHYNSGTYAYFREAVLGRGGRYKLGSLDMLESKDVVELVQNTPGAIGYSGLAHATDNVKIVPVSTDGADPVVPAVDSASDQSYPIARPLFMYTAGAPEGVVKEYIDWILSEEGQTILLKKGYAPVLILK